MLTIVEGFMHYIYATFHVDLMYGSEVMDPNLPFFFKFLIGEYDVIHVNLHDIILYIHKLKKFL